jgi:hypothetical protein
VISAVHKCCSTPQAGFVSILLVSFVFLRPTASHPLDASYPSTPFFHMSIRSTFPAAEPRRKENQFVIKRGHKHHNYPPGKAPYPISYDRDILDRYSSLSSTKSHSRTSKSFSVSDAMDHHLWSGLFDDRPTMMVTPNYPPKRVLDLGCGVRHLSCIP